VFKGKPAKTYPFVLDTFQEISVACLVSFYVCQGLRCLGRMKEWLTVTMAIVVCDDALKVADAKELKRSDEPFSCIWSTLPHLQGTMASQ
jgi:hypothetical protein